MESVEPVTTIERMLSIAPIFVYRRDGAYHCNWTVNLTHGHCARGKGDTWALASYNAWKHAHDEGWLK